MSNLSQPSTILCPLPRRTHSNPIYTTNHNHTIHTINHPSKPTIRNQKESSDDVLSEFLSLFTPPSEPSRQPILIYNNHLDASVQPVNQSNNSSQPPSLVRTTNSTPLSSPSSSSPPPSLPPKSNDIHHNQPSSHDPQTIYPQVGLAIAPNHLSSIVSSPISRCHNPLPRHAELDVLASRLNKPLDPFQFDPIHVPLEEDEERPPSMAQPDNPLSNLMPALTLEPSVLSSRDL